MHICPYYFIESAPLWNIESLLNASTFPFFLLNIQYHDFSYMMTTNIFKHARTPNLLYLSSAPAWSWYAPIIPVNCDNSWSNNYFLSSAHTYLKQFLKRALFMCSPTTIFLRAQTLCSLQMPSRAQVLLHSNTRKCSCTQMLANALALKCSQMLLHSNALALKWSCTQVILYSSDLALKWSCTQMLARAQVLLHSNACSRARSQVLLRTNALMHKYFSELTCSRAHS